MTSKGKKYLWILFISLGLAIFSGGKFLYLIFTILFITLLYSYYSLNKAKKNLYHFFWVSNRTLRVGDSLQIGYKLNNTSIIPIAYVEITCNISKKLGDITFPVEYAFIKPIQMISINKEFICKHRGYYKLGKLHVKIKDLLGIFEKDIIFNKNIDVTVYPRIHEINSIRLVATEYFGVFRVPYITHEDYTSIKNIREYVVGDNVKKIHWKASAGREKIYVKEYELSANTKINIFIDGYKDSFRNDLHGDIEEKMIETAATIINYCLKNNLNTSLISTTIEKIYVEGRSLNKLEIFLKELIGFSPKGEISIHDFITIESRKLTYGSILFILTTKLTNKMLETLISLKERRFNPVIILITDNNSILMDEKEMEVYLNKKGIETYRISLDSNIKSVLEECSWSSESKV